MFKAILEKMNVESAPVAEATGNDADAGRAGTEMDVSTRAATAASEHAPLTDAIDPEKVKEAVIEALRTVYDPEIPVNIYELGLVYDIDVRSDGFTTVKMTLTSPSCPVAGSLPGEVEMKTKSAAGVSDAKVELVWEPAWNMTMMTEAARLQLNLL